MRTRLRISLQRQAYAKFFGVTAKQIGEEVKGIQKEMQGLSTDT